MKKATELVSSSHRRSYEKDSTRAQVVSITRVGRTALGCLSIIMVVKACIPFMEKEEMVV